MLLLMNYIFIFIFICSTIFFIIIKIVTYLMTTKSAEKSTKAQEKTLFMLPLVIHIAWQQACGVCCPLFSTVLTSQHHLFHKAFL